MFSLDSAVPRPHLRLFRIGDAYKETARRKVLAIYFSGLEPVQHGLLGNAQHRRDRVCGHHIGAGGSESRGHGDVFPIFVVKKGVMLYVFPE